MRAIYFQSLISCKIKTTVKFKNVLFAALSYTFLLPLYISHSDLDISCSMVPTFQYPSDITQPPVVLAHSLLVPKCSSLPGFS